MDPFVEVGVHGLPADEVKFVTHTVDDNGFNPRWDCLYTFDVRSRVFRSEPCSTV